jgi:hypothetical protein
MSLKYIYFLLVSNLLGHLCNIVTDFLKTSLGALAPTLCNNSGYVILADV